MQALQMVHEIDPADEISAEVKHFVSDVEPLGAQILVAVYMRPEKTKGGIIVPDSTSGTRTEDRYQGKVGLVLKIGPLAFSEDDKHHWGDRVPKAGDWILYRVGDTFPFILGKRTCRFVEDVDVKAIVKRPDIVL